MPVFDAVVLAGGGSRRLGGQDKTQLIIGGRTLLEHAVLAAAGAERVVVVGPPRPVSADVTWTCEDPPGGGPVAGLSAGLEHCEAGLVVVLAADLPFVTAGVVADLLSATGAAAGAVAVDTGWRPQWLLSAWRVADLRTALRGAARDGTALRDVLGSLRYTPVPVDALTTFDCDTPADVETARCQATTATSTIPAETRTG